MVRLNRELVFQIPWRAESRPVFVSRRDPRRGGVEASAGRAEAFLFDEHVVEHGAFVDVARRSPKVLLRMRASELSSAANAQGPVLRLHLV